MTFEFDVEGVQHFKWVIEAEDRVDADGELERLMSSEGVDEWFVADVRECEDEPSND